jgi:hypothetical protein
MGVIVPLASAAAGVVYDNRSKIYNGIKMGIEWGPELYNNLSDAGKQGVQWVGKTWVAGKVYNDMKPTIKAGLMVVIVGGGFFLFNGFGIFNPNYKASKPKVSAPKITKK